MEVRVVQGEVVEAVMIGLLDWLPPSESQFVMLGEFDWKFLLGSFLHGSGDAPGVGGGLAHHPSSHRLCHHQVSFSSSFLESFGGQLHHPSGGEAVHLPFVFCSLVFVVLLFYRQWSQLHHPGVVGGGVVPLSDAGHQSH